MNSTAAIFIKQLQDILKNMEVLVQFIIFPAMGFIMTRFIDVSEGLADEIFISMFASMFVGMSLIGVTATAIAEDREKKSLSFLMMAGVKSHEYLLGIGGVFLACALVISSIFSIMMPDFSVLQMLLMLTSMMLGAAASILCGASIGMLSKNTQAALSVSMAMGMFLGFGPMIANFNENRTVDRILGIFYTKNFIYEDFNTDDIIRRLAIILANVAVLAAVFTWAYSKQDFVKGGNKMKHGKKLAALLALALAVGAGAGGYYIWQNASHIATDNARVMTTLIPLSSDTSGVLERFELYEGQRVHAGEILGWVENGEAMRAPVDGLVINISAVRGQTVAALESLAVIAASDNFHIQANIEETDILKIQAGQPAIVTIDGFGSRQFEGYVSHIAHITQAELRGSNTSGNFTRRTHLIPVEITLTDDIDLSNLIGVNAKLRIPIGNMPLQAAAISNNIVVTGVVESSESRNIYSTLGFTVERVYVKAGDYVEAGQLLAELDTADLELQIAQQRAAMEQARQNSRNAVSDTQRMLSEAQINLTNNTNIQIVSAEASLNAVTIALEAAQRNYDDALRDYELGGNQQVLSAESSLRTAITELEKLERDHTNTVILYSAGAVSSEQMRQIENSLALSRNQYGDALSRYDNARETEQRLLEQLRNALQSAVTARDSAQELLNASQIAAEQEIERLRSEVTSAELSTNLEHMETALKQLERQLNDASVTSPISGTVTSVTAKEGAVGSGLMFTVEDTDNIKIITRFRESDLVRLAQGMEVSITSDGTGSAVYTGELSRINPAAASSSPVVEFEAEISVTSPETNLRIGMNTRINISLKADK